MSGEIKIRNRPSDSVDMSIFRNGSVSFASNVPERSIIRVCELCLGDGSSVVTSAFQFLPSFYAFVWP